MTVLSNLSVTSQFSLSSKPSGEGRFDSSAQTTTKTENSAGEPAYVTFQAGMGSNANSASAASAIDTIREVNAKLIGTRAKQAPENPIPLTAGTTATAADSPTYLDTPEVKFESDTPPSASPTAIAPTAIPATVIRTQTAQLAAFDQKLRPESNDPSGTPSYFRSDSVGGERGAEQVVSDIASSTPAIQPRQTEFMSTQPIRDINAAESAAAATYQDIISQQRQGLSAQANQNPMQVLQLLK